VTKEMLGYAKPDMNPAEVREERRLFEQHQYSLNFMLNDQNLHDDEEIKDVILREMEKEHNSDELFNLDDKLMLSCGTKNGFIQAVI